MGELFIALKVIHKPFTSVILINYYFILLSSVIADVLAIKLSSYWHLVLKLLTCFSSVFLESCHFLSPVWLILRDPLGQVPLTPWRRETHHTQHVIAAVLVDNPKSELRIHVVHASLLHLKKIYFFNIYPSYQLSFTKEIPNIIKGNCSGKYVDLREKKVGNGKYHILRNSVIYIPYLTSSG